LEKKKLAAAPKKRFFLILGDLAIPIDRSDTGAQRRQVFLVFGDFAVELTGG
jgi:hypothetical protein